MDHETETEDKHEDSSIVNEMSLSTNNQGSDDESDDDNIFVFKKKSTSFRASRKKILHLDSDDEENTSVPEASVMNRVQSDEESRDSAVVVSKPKFGKKKRVMKVLDDDSSAEENNQKSDSDEATVKSGRIVNKRNKMVEKFKNRFINKKSFFVDTLSDSSEHKDSTNNCKSKLKEKSSSHRADSDEDEFKDNSSIKENNVKESSVSKKNKINDIRDIIEQNSSDSHNSDSGDNLNITSSLQKQKLKDLCDDDSESDISERESDHEHMSHSHVPVHREQHDKPKEKRMSAKLAMENMQKIKSESNRMLREKEVSLPYHRPRQMSLKDILNRRKPITGLDGKKLPIKMNEEQLKQYAQQLEERQKEIIELCKSESEEGSDEDEKVSTKVSGDEKETESLSKTENKLVADDDADNNKVNIFIEESEDFVENCVQDEIETQVVGSVKQSAEIIQNNNIQLCSVDIETQVSEHVTIHETNTSVDSQAMELTYSENTELFLKESDEMVDEEDNFVQNNENEDNLNLPKNHNSIEMDENPTDEIHCDNKTGDHQEKLDFINDQNCTETETKDLIEERSYGGNDFDDNFSDNDVDMSQIEDIIDKMEKERSKEIVHATDLKFEKVPTLNPKLSGAPGSVIDLDSDSSGPTLPKKLTGVDLLKEKFVYFSQLKTPEEKEREKEKVIKPGQQHLKLKQELEEQMAEQRSLEWAKRIEEDKIRQQEMKQMNGELSDCEDILEKDCFDKEEKEASDSDKEESEEEELNDHEEVEEKPTETNPLLDDEAEEDDDEENEDLIVEENEEDIGSEGDDEEDSSGEDSVSEEHDEAEDQPKKPKQSRILKAFEDSDDDEIVSTKDEETRSIPRTDKTEKDVSDIEIKNTMERADTDDMFSTQQSESDKAHDYDELPLAQQNSFFTQASQEEDDGARTNTACIDQKIVPITNTQQNTQFELGDIVGMCSGSFPTTQSEQVSPAVSMMVRSVLLSCEERGSQNIGEDLLAMCTGQFTEGIISPTQAKDADFNYDSMQETQPKVISHPKGSNLNESLRDLLDMETDTDKGMNFFSAHLYDKPKNNKENDGNGENIKAKGKLVIMSSDDEGAAEVYHDKRKVLKKRTHREKKRKQLLISDDEDSNMMAENDSLAGFDDNIDRLVEYDSEENEVELDMGDIPKMVKRRGTDFLDQEAELSSEDEWKGSGDEDEAGLDQLEREDGDDDHYNQKKLRSELEKIHMRQLLDQDKREVRLLQELLLEDGELAGGHRQRKFRWKNNDLESEQLGTVPDDELVDKQDEVESEEQWRKQRHEREVFLRQLTEQKKDDSVLDVSFNRTSIIKANLESKSMSSLLLEVKSANSSTTEAVTAEENKNHTVAVDKKITLKELPSPVKKPFLMQKQFRGSFLSRGQSSLDRLAALARPLSGEEERPGLVHSSNKRSCVFSAVSPPCPNAQLNEKTKMAKRKADAAMSTPVLIKKFRVDDKRDFLKKSLLDQIDT